ncbi:MAG TPA: DASS family sodium-coupled anion symporter [Dissulfurispiraceae bacterium]|nr:DASS family sodium-coupled anion symporter [Dissulfurispiraceae bacterium]
MADAASPPNEIKLVKHDKQESFDRWRANVGLFLGPLVAIAIYFMDMPALSAKAHVLAAIISWVVIWWICEPIPLPITGVLGAVLCVLMDVEGAKKVFAPFAEPIIYVFLGSFMLAEAMSYHGLDRRFAYWIMSLKAVGNSSARILGAFGVITASLSMWISNTAATAMMFPIALGIVYALADIQMKKSGKQFDPLKMRFGTGMMLMAAYASSTGGIATPVGTPPNIIGIAMIEKFVGVKIQFFQWMSFAVPLMIVLFVLLYILMYFLHKPEVARVEGGTEFVAKELAAMGPWSRGEKNALIAFLVTVCLWITPGFLAAIGSPFAKTYSKHMPEAVAALLGATLLFLLPVDWKARKFTLNMKQAMKIDWGTLLLFGAGLALGDLMFSTKLAEVMGTKLLAFSGASSLWGITLGSIFCAIVISETCSNTASANMIIPVMIAIALAAGVNPIPPAIGAALGASWGFMLPVSTPPNAIVYGSGMVPITKMIRAGVFYGVLGGFTIWGGLYILLPLVGLVK